MTYPVVQFVDAPSLTANLRLDLNDDFGDATCRVEHDGFTLGVPSFNGSPDSSGGSYGIQQPSLPLQIQGPKSAALEVLAAVSRELLRSSNWVRFLLDEFGGNRWLRIYRNSFQDLSLEFVKNDSGTDIWRLPVTLNAEAFAYGERVVIDPVTIGNALDAANPLRAVLPAIKGDAPTPLRVSVTPQGPEVRRAGQWMLTSVASDLPAADLDDPTYDIGTADQWVTVSGGGATTIVTDADFLGGSYARINYATEDPDLTWYLVSNLSSSPTTGRYKVLLHCEADPPTSGDVRTYFFELRQGLYRTGQRQVSITTPTGDAATAVPFQGWVDLGDITVPMGTDVPPDIDLTPVAPEIALLVGHGDTDASGSVRLDAVRLIPLDRHDIHSTTTLLTTTEWGLQGEADLVYGNGPDILAEGAFSSTDTATWDGDAETGWKTDVTTGRLLDRFGSSWGAFPVADPSAVTNVLYAFPTQRGFTSDTDAATEVDAEWEVAVSYHPRLLYGDGT